MINDLKLIENIGILFENKVVLYGNGIQGKKTFETLKRAGVKVACFCDSNHEKSGDDTFSPYRLKKLDEKESIAIIITVESFDFIKQIEETLKELEIRTENVFTQFGLNISLKQNIRDLRIDETFRDFCLDRNSINYDKSSYSDSIFSARLCHLEDNLWGKHDVLVLTPAKVGTTTLHKSLNEIGVRHTICHGLSRLPPCHDRYSTKEFKSDFLFISKWYHKAIEKSLKQKTIKIITLIREPTARDLSIFFEAFYYNHPVMLWGDSFLSACLGFIENYYSKEYPHGYMFDWFDFEIKTPFGIDVFAYPFDKEKGYTIIKKDSIEILLMKLEKLNSLEGVVGDFVGEPAFKLIKSNEGDKKVSGYLYNDVKKAIKIPGKHFSVYYENNTRMDHFYTDEEKAAFLKKWENNIGD